jgi:hypothetical protein
MERFPGLKTPDLQALRAWQASPPGLMPGRAFADENKAFSALKACERNSEDKKKFRESYKLLNRGPWDLSILFG